MIFAMKQVVPPFADARSDFEIMRGIAIGLASGASSRKTGARWTGSVTFMRRPVPVSPPRSWLADFETFWPWPVEIAQKPIQPTSPFAAIRAIPPGDESGRIVLYSRTLAARAYPDCPPHPTWMEPGEWLGAPLSKRYGFHLLSAQGNSRLHSQLDNGRVSQATRQRAGRRC